MDRLCVLMVGNRRSLEFHEAVEQLTASVDVLFADDLPSATTMIGHEEATPDLVILAQCFPRQFSVDGVDRLRRIVPTAHIVAMLGSWCEGEERSGEPLPGTQRVYWHRWTAWWNAQQQLLATRRCPDWGRAVTLAEDDRQLVADSQDTQLSHAIGPPCVIAVAARHWDVADWLGEACRHWGYAAVGVDPRERLPSVTATAVVWDCRDPDDLVEVARLRRHFGDIPMMALVNFPRWHHREALLAAGVTDLLAKPVRLNELHTALQSMIPKAETDRHAHSVSRVA